MFGDDLIEAFRQFKAAWDPEWKMNPGKVIDCYGITENLALGTDYDPPLLKTHFAFGREGGSFAEAADRCVGVGTCRRIEPEDSGVMCPSYMVTREEIHSTRGRSRLLFEMMRGDEVGGPWDSKEVHEALDLCLACKGCLSDCPVNVDMATYKAEFYSHYYKHHLRPRAAFSMGLIYWWSRLASYVPNLANVLSQTPALASLAKEIGGITQHREIPPFATETFKTWFRRRAPRNVGAPQALLWPDTFTNHLHPEVAKAAVDVIEHMGWQVTIPQASLCCGRPLYDYGFLDEAKRLWREVIDTLRPQIRAGVPLIGLEPSCLAAFRDELVNLFPHDEDAKRLSKQSLTLAEFLLKHCDEDRLPRLERKALVHPHCHHHAVMKFHKDQQLFKKIGLDAELTEAGCCGLAGSFGFEADHYDISMAIGERKLLPTVRELDPDTLLLADGFSCETQIQHGTGRKAMHLAQELKMAFHDGARGTPGPRPERTHPKVRTKFRPTKTEIALTTAAGVMAGGLIAWGTSKALRR
jgi:Fe-S oxidoreductase